MERAVEKSVFKGRSYGGTATPIHNKWRAFIMIATVERYVIIALGNLLFINIYLLNNCSGVMNEVETILKKYLSIWINILIISL